MCDISESGKSNVEIIPIDDYYYINNTMNVTIGRDKHRRLRNEHSKKFQEDDEISVNFNLTELKSDFIFNFENYNNNSYHIQYYLVEKSKKDRIGLKEVS